MEKNLKAFILKKGLLLGGVLVVILYLEYAIDKELTVNGYLTFLFTMLMPVIYVVFMIRDYRIKQNDNYIEFKEAFSVSFGIMFLAIILYTGASMLLFDVIDPEFKEQITQIQLNKQVEMFEGMGMSKEEIVKTLKDVEEYSKTSVKTILITFGIFSALNALLSLLIAAVSKKARPLFEDTLD